MRNILLNRCALFSILLYASAAHELLHPTDLLDYNEHPCKRTCRADDEPKVCKYTFVVERYASMSKACYDCPYNVSDCFRPHCIPADGVRKVVYSINRQVPGPTIEVCENDVLEVDVRNELLSESTTIHWHGIRQFYTPFMDGVPFVTQCPILPGQNFIYNFTATNPGTYFYHSHVGFQASDGMIGALIVHKASDVEKFEVHGEHVVMVNDWSHKSAADNYVMMHHDRISENNPSTILVNGLGRREIATSTGNRTEYTPTAEFAIEQGKTYRFRMILGGFDDCFVRMSIDEHEMQIISLDGNDIEPVTVDAMTMWSGERVDFLLRANQRPSVYLMRFKGYFACTKYGRQVALLRYDNATETRAATSEPERRPRMLNPYNVGTESASPYNVVVPELRSVEIARDEGKADRTFHIVFDYYKLDNLDFQHPLHYGYASTLAYNRSMSSVQLNRISMRMPTRPLASQWDSIDDDAFCGEDVLSGEIDCTERHCRCTHVLRVDLNSTVELILVDEGDLGRTNHPFHLHGHSFRVVAEQNLDGVVTLDRVKRLDRDGKIRRNVERAPIKDTVKVPSGGFTIVRFHADNPGYWLFHCHVEQHSHAGMALVFKVGEHEDFPAVPEDFPKC